MNYQTRLSKACGILNKILSDAKKEHPDACLYLAGSLHLMSGPHHFDRSNSNRTSGEDANQEAIIASAALDADGGDW